MPSVGRSVSPSDITDGEGEGGERLAAMKFYIFRRRDGGGVRAILLQVLTDINHLSPFPPLLPNKAFLKKK